MRRVDRCVEERATNMFPRPDLTRVASTGEKLARVPKFRPSAENGPTATDGAGAPSRTGIRIATWRA
jgi:hypothetical protein